MQARVVIVIPASNQDMTEIVRTIALERLMEPKEPRSSP
jgi:hypothetical protein